MKKMILVAIAAVLFSSHALALGDQYSFYGITLNYAYTQQKGIAETNPERGFYNMLNGFNAGFMFQQQLYKGLVLVSGLQYQFTMAKGIDLDLFGDLDDLIGMQYKDVAVMDHRLRVPVKFGFSTPFADKWSFTVFAGPCLDFNVAYVAQMKIDNDNYVNCDIVNGKFTAVVDGEKQTDSSEDGKILGCFDIPLGLGTMVKYGNFGMKFEYEWGMINRCKGEAKGDGGNIKTDQFTIGFFYTF